MPTLKGTPERPVLGRVVTEALKTAEPGVEGMAEWAALAAQGRWRQALVWVAAHTGICMRQLAWAVGAAINRVYLVGQEAAPSSWPLPTT